MNVGSVGQSFSSGCDGTRESKFKTIKEDFKKLQSALKSGDLKAAQDAYAALKQDLPQKNSTTSATGSSNQATTDLDAIGSALQSGDISGAQKAFATFQQDVQSARASHAHHHHHVQDQGGEGNDSTTTNGNYSVSTGIDARGLNVQA